MDHVLAATLADPDLELFGENMTATHSIAYAHLTSYFYLFGVKKRGHWLSWAEVEGVAASLDVPTVPVRFLGRVESLKQLQFIIEHTLVPLGSCLGADEGAEGFVVRRAGGFPCEKFPLCIAKYVRANHIQTGDDFRRVWPRNKTRLSNSHSLQPPPRLDERAIGTTHIPLRRSGQNPPDEVKAKRSQNANAALVAVVGCKVKEEKPPSRTSVMS